MPLNLPSDNGGAHFDHIVAALLVTAAGIVPLVWWPSSGDSFGTPKMWVLRLVVAAAVLVTGLGVAVYGTIRIRRPSLVGGALLAWVACNAAAFINSGDHRQSLYGEEFQHHGVVLLLAAAATFVLARRVFTSARSTGALLAALAVSGVLVAGYAIVQQAGGDPWWHRVEFGRPPDGQIPVFSSIGHASALAAFLVVAITASLPLLTHRRALVRLAAVGAVAAMIVAVAFTGNRGGYLALGLALGVMGLASLPRSRAGRQRLAAGLAAAAIVLGLAVAAIPPARRLAVAVWERTETITASGPSSRVRLELWKAGIHLAADHPLLGTGQETYPQAFAEHSSTYLDPAAAAWLSNRRAESAHSLFLTIAAEAGFPALAAFLLLVGAAIHRQVAALRRPGEPRVRATLAAALAASAGFLLAAAFMNPEVTTTWVFWLLLGAGTGFAESTLRPAPSGGPTPSG